MSTVSRSRPRGRLVALATAVSMLGFPVHDAAAGPPVRTRGGAAGDDGSADSPPDVPPDSGGATDGGGSTTPSSRTPVQMTGDEAAAMGPNTCKKWPAGQRFTVTIPREAELEQLVQWMMTISCQKFIWNAKVRSGKVTILSPEKVTLQEAYAAFYAALESMGLTVEPAGDYFKIVETADPSSLNLPLYDDDANSPNNDRFVTQLIRVKSGNPAEISGVLAKMKSKTGAIETVGNLLIITDRGSIVQRLSKIVEELDTAGGTGEKIFFYQLQYADAEEVATIVREIFGENSARTGSSASAKNKKGATGSFSRVIVDERTGTLVIISNASEYETIVRLVKQLDVRLPGGGGRIHVKRLKHADPKEVATVLTTLATGAQQAAKNDKSGNKSATEGGVSAELFSGDIKVTADEASHSLVILASAADFKNLERVIDELDAPRKQVYIEMYLLEVSVNRNLTAGAGGHFALPIQTSQGQGVGIVSSAPSPDVNSLLLSPQALQGLAGGALGPLIPGSGNLLGLGRDIPAFGVVIQAIQTLDDTNVVAEPHVYTADNQEAEIEVGQKVPTPGQLSFGGAGGGTSLTPVVGIQREDVTLRIKVTPHVSDEKTVTLDVDMEDRDVLRIDPTLGVTTSKRRVKLESVLAHDDQPVVLGGLLREREVINAQQVPGLGQIPILGWLFKRRTKRKEKVNLLLVMVPHIVDGPDDIRRIHERRSRERMEFLERETNFKKRDLDANVNYRKKAGMLASVDREARRLEQEELILRQAEQELSQERITGELGDGVRVAGDGADDTSTATVTTSPARARKAAATSDTSSSTTTPEVPPVN